VVGVSTVAVTTRSTSITSSPTARAGRKMSKTSRYFANGATYVREHVYRAHSPGPNGRGGVEENLLSDKVFCGD
jgi:hypothetical protein